MNFSIRWFLLLLSYERKASRILTAEMLAKFANALKLGVEDLCVVNVKMSKVVIF
ncbi:hypothetical protein MmTuc01_1634 [Methanosarcina mazei Tuc01]|jgi:hypothetical protein|uniref:Uncharacterized protein n=1 Tax=Methanosarcina mazei Tuc01 TaxID=1236903 RepID=M1QJ54_METMZ|nr:hypothetical protein MmTuc01_1634 [Methanosarcina mazei Tuc01]